MTREGAINVLREIIDESWVFSDIEKAPTIDACEMAISALSENKGEWIPVSERLPEEEGDYILWGKVTEFDEEEYQFIGGYDSGCEKFGVWEEQYDRTTLGCLGSEFFEYNRVLAWQPLPEPYKAESEDEE